MIVGHSKNVEGVTVKGEGIMNVMKKVLVSPKEGWEGWVMRLFELGPNGHTPQHSHDWPHINWIVEGKGILHLEGIDHPIEAGSFAYVPSNALHQFKNASETTLSFICIVPEEGEV